MKKLIVFLCMFACLLSLTACSSDTTDNMPDYDEEELVEQTKYIIVSLESMDVEDIEYYATARNEELADDDDTALEIKASYQSWLDSVDILGAYTPSDSDTYEFTCDEDEATVVVYATFENRQGKITAYYDYNSDLLKFFVEPVYSVAENMQKALLNTILGICTVFVVLLLIAFIIYLFKYINKAETYFAHRKDEKTAPAQQVQTQVTVQTAPVQNITENEEVDDLELIAVITAALAASMNTSIDQLVVRSVKRRSTNKWQKA